MPIDLSRPETFLIAFSDRGDQFAVAVKANDQASARLAFERMTTAERRANIVARLSPPERTAGEWIATWMAALMERRRRAA